MERTAVRLGGRDRRRNAGRKLRLGVRGQRGWRARALRRGISRRVGHPVGLGVCLEGSSFICYQLGQFLTPPGYWRCRGRKVKLGLNSGYGLYFSNRTQGHRQVIACGCQETNVNVAFRLLRGHVDTILPR
jgi:hypothetical protein